jgi:hypothetical protein
MTSTERANCVRPSWREPVVADGDRRGSALDDREIPTGARGREATVDRQPAAQERHGRQGVPAAEQHGACSTSPSTMSSRIRDEETTAEPNVTSGLTLVWKRGSPPSIGASPHPPARGFVPSPYRSAPTSDSVLWRTDGQRMRVKGKYRVAPGDHLLVADMDAVEYPDRHGTGTRTDPQYIDETGR